MPDVRQQSSKVKLFGAQRRSEIAKLLQFQELMEAMCGSGRHEAGISMCEVSRKKCNGPKKDDLLKMMAKPSCCFSRYTHIKDWN
jgi:hypothetical protein